MCVKRLQIMIEEELDAALARQAAEEGVSKAALIRRYVGERLRPLPLPEDDPLWSPWSKGARATRRVWTTWSMERSDPGDLRRHVRLDRRFNRGRRPPRRRPS